MLLDERYLNSINSWFVITDTINGIVVDRVVLNLGVNKIDVEFKFPRFKSFHYNHLIRDYVIFFCRDYEFIQLKNQLKNLKKYKQNIYLYKNKECGII